MEVHEFQWHFCQRSPDRLAAQEEQGGPLRAPWSEHWPGARQTRDLTLFNDQMHSTYLFSPPITASQASIEASSPTRLCSGQFHWLGAGQGRDGKRGARVLRCRRQHPQPSPARPTSLPKVPRVFLNRFMVFCWGVQRVQNTTRSSLHFRRTFICILVSSYLLPLDFY